MPNPYSKLHEEFGADPDEEAEERYDQIRNALEDEIQEMADCRAAEGWSTPTDSMLDELGVESEDDLWVQAEFGDCVAVNGDVVDRVQEPPEGFEYTNFGGDIPVDEMEVDVESAAEAVARDLGLPVDEVLSVAREEYPPQRGYWAVHVSVSGDAEVYARASALGMAEGDEEDENEE